MAVTPFRRRGPSYRHYPCDPDDVELISPKMAPDQANQSGNQDNGRKRHLEEEDRDESEGGNAPHDSILQAPCGQCESRRPPRWP